MLVKGREWTTQVGDCCTLSQSAHIFLVGHDGHLSGAATHSITPRRWAQSSERIGTCPLLHLTATDAGAVSLLRERAGVLCQSHRWGHVALADFSEILGLRHAIEAAGAETTKSARFTRARSPLGEAPGTRRDIRRTRVQDAGMSRREMSRHANLRLGHLARAGLN